ncbi:MAG TPA: undecaprenyldiphospho-muramoylpentapeptide beta-N-acetylglucosaminyltransferase [Caulobacteraceae bacterium]
MTEAAKLAVIAAGGTGGHLFPAQALSEALIARGWRIVLITDTRTEGFASAFPAEQKIAVTSATLAGGAGSRARQLVAILRGTLQARAALARLRPAIVIGFGGYPSIPPLLAARSLGLKTLIHEANAVMGRANRLLAAGASAVACAFPSLAKARAADRARAVVVGNPVREAIRALAGGGYRASEGQDAFHLLVTGGSQGARRIAEVVPQAFALLSPELRNRMRVAQQTRAEQIEAVRQVYRAADAVELNLEPFFADMAGLLSWSHLLIGRSGASTVSEIATAGRPAILVPLGIALDDDQGQNARLMAETGAAVVVREADLEPVGLAKLISELAGDPARLTAMAVATAKLAKPQAAGALADLVEQTARR